VYLCPKVIQDIIKYHTNNNLLSSLFDLDIQLYNDSLDSNNCKMNGSVVLDRPKKIQMIKLYHPVVLTTLVVVTRLAYEEMIYNAKGLLDIQK
jgi:hypothetical protein